MGINLTINIKILDLTIPTPGLIGVLLGFAALLLIVYFVITFSLFRSKNKNDVQSSIIKLKQEVSFKENVEYFEQEIMLAKKYGCKD
ncbi:hypothetical protein [Spiroplasma eriocheiris]|uniref:Uncharacterized protein n=1 Tax=Spiroplasma eriocheiris TaxID=315358 RepID=A0A0H3XKK9_9MOLU|nr:hypothetical protein [Spiroplasma eriocheiris]AHF58019.1 hypothetical protein SPE_0899 [Spiroplasma eriocheiris CCTCC M 207170]AKM54461.1 hypothetical protein SERIO_v1c09010 [Spiroplasma eriocheiris]